MALSSFDLHNKNILILFLFGSLPCYTVIYHTQFSENCVVKSEITQKLKKMSYLQIIEEKGEFSIPSCYGNIKKNNGGSSLTFEHPLDDVNVVDLKWIHDFVLKSLELLYQVEKWETLVSLAIQFNTISQ